MDIQTVRLLHYLKCTVILNVYIYRANVLTITDYLPAYSTIQCGNQQILNNRTNQILFRSNFDY